MKKFLLSAFAFIVALAFVGCGSENGGSGSTVDTCDGEGVILITDTGGIDDKSFNQGTWEGLEKLSEDEDICTAYITSSEDADYIPNISAAVDNDPDLIVTAGFLFADSVTKAAEEFPDQNFLIIDSPITDENGDPFPNVASAVFAEHEGSYLVGVAAAMQAKADGYDKVGFLGGVESEVINRFRAGYVAGVHSVDPNMEVAVSYIGDFQDAALGKIEAEKMYNDGAYVIFVAAGSSGNGVIQESIERYQAYSDGKSEEYVWVIGVDRDQYDEGLVPETDHSVILTSMLKEVGVAAYDVGLAASNDNFESGNILYTLADDGVGIPEENPNLSEEILAAVEAAKNDVVSGAVEVPSEVE